MSNNMLAIRESQQQSKPCKVNILPCRIHHNGPAKVTKRHWSPATSRDGSKISYFRGRQLKGKAVKLPKGYTGVISHSTDRSLPQQAPKQNLAVGDDDSDLDVQIIDDEPEPEPVKVLESTARFNEVIVWGHDQTPDNDDTFVKGVEEWLAFADAIHRP